MVDDAGNLVGVLSEVDLMEVIIQDSYYDEAQGIVGDYMRTPVDTIDPDMDIYSLAERFHKEHRRRYPVVKNGKLVGTDIPAGRAAGGRGFSDASGAGS